MVDRIGFNVSRTIPAPNRSCWVDYARPHRAGAHVVFRVHCPRESLTRELTSRDTENVSVRAQIGSEKRVLGVEKSILFARAGYLWARSNCAAHVRRKRAGAIAPGTSKSSWPPRKVYVYAHMACVHIVRCVLAYA